MAATRDAPDSALASVYSIKHMLPRLSMNSRTKDADFPVPSISEARRNASLNDAHNDFHDHLSLAETETGSVLYLAYGSNLSKETFRGNRGIKPLSQINVQVPCLRLTFDLPGIPYSEPCFANSGARDPENDPPRSTARQQSLGEKSPLLSKDAHPRSHYRKNDWHKGLVGVVYEVTAKDYAHIIATEGGGSSYHDILVDCHPFASSDPLAPVPQNPTLPHFRAHTLFAPATPSGEDPPKDRGRFQRPDTSYAQSSARYLKLITDGAAELDLPHEYQDYLHSLRPYSITSNKQRVGQFVFLGLWLPFVLMIFAMMRMFQDGKGRNPRWLTQLSGAIFKGMWNSYDASFEPMFGDGERSISDGSHVPSDDETAVKATKRLGRGVIERDLEKAQRRAAPP